MPVPVRALRRASLAVGRTAGAVALTVAGFTLLLAGAAMMVLPGPGVLVMAAGFALLGRRYNWARRVNQALLERMRAGKARLTGQPNPAPSPGAPGKDAAAGRAAGTTGTGT